MLEIQERVSETTDRDELLDILSEITQRKDSLEQALSKAFSEDNVFEASELVTELSYLHRIITNTREKM